MKREMKGGDYMKPLHMLMVILVTVGAVNWGLVGAAQYNLVESLFGAGTTLTNLVYILVGVSGVWLFAQHKGECKSC